MKKVSTAELKAHLGKYLGMVREGETLYVTAHRRPVASLSPCSTDESLSIQPPTLPLERLRQVEGRRLASGGDAVQALLQDRRDR